MVSGLSLMPEWLLGGKHHRPGRSPTRQIQREREREREREKERDRQRERERELLRSKHIHKSFVELTTYVSYSKQCLSLRCWTKF